MLKWLTVYTIVVAFLAGCTTSVPSTPSAATDPIIKGPAVEITPVPLDAYIPGTVFDAGFARSCTPDVKTVAFRPDEIVGGSGFVEKAVEGGRILYEISKGTVSTPDVPDIASITLEGDFSPLAVIVNSRESAPLTNITARTIVLPGELFAPLNANGKIYGVRICYR